MCQLYDDSRAHTSLLCCMWFSTFKPHRRGKSHVPWVARHTPRFFRPMDAQLWPTGMYEEKKPCHLTFSMSMVDNGIICVDSGWMQDKALQTNGCIHTMYILTRSREISINTRGSWKVRVQYCKSKSLYACFFTQSMSLFNNQCALRCASLFFIHIVNSNKLKRNKVNYSYNCVRGFYNCPELWIIRSGSQINDFQWLQ